MSPDLSKTRAVREVGNCSRSAYPGVRSVVNIVPLSQRTLPFQLKLRPAAMLAESLALCASLARFIALQEGELGLHQS